MPTDLVPREIRSLVAEACHDEALTRAMRLADIAMSNEPRRVIDLSKQVARAPGMGGLARVKLGTAN